jgi:hypothetical protein
MLSVRLVSPSFVLKVHLVLLMTTGHAVIAQAASKPTTGKNMFFFQNLQNTHTFLRMKYNEENVMRGKTLGI